MLKDKDGSLDKNYTQNSLIESSSVHIQSSIVQNQEFET